MDIATTYDRHIADFIASRGFIGFETGALSREQYDQIVCNIVRTHCRSPQLLAFLFALAPPPHSAALRDNLLEELGIEGAALGDNASHPRMLDRFAVGAGLEQRLAECKRQADDDLRQLVCAPMMYESLMHVGYAALIEITAFEHLLCRVADRMARSLTSHRGLDDGTLAWLTHHGMVDIDHAAAGLRNLDHYRRYYGIDERDAATMVDITTRRNLFVDRYFAGVATAGEALTCA